VAEVAEFKLASQARAQRLVGCGVQFNQNVFAPLTGAPPESFPDLEDKVLRLAPQFVRLFWNERQATRLPANRASFLRAVRLAQQTGATINITWQSGKLDTEDAREKRISRFADVLDELISGSDGEDPVSNIRWVTIQNEPNTLPKRNPQTGKTPVKQVTPERLDDMYERLDKHLTDKGLRPAIQFMGGDLIRTKPDTQQAWFEHMAAHADLFGAYSAHIYWDYFKPAYCEQRLQEVQQFAGPGKPLFVTEFGVRGKRRPPNPGVFEDGSPKGRPLAYTKVAAFQQAWFMLRALQLGYAGLIKWDCFHGKYDRSYTASHYLIGPGSKGWPLYPSYYLLRLITMTTGPGWQIREITPNRSDAAASKVLVALAGPGNQLTILGLDTRGKTDNKIVSRQPISYTIAGLTANTTFTCVYWNRGGGGHLAPGGTIHADAGGSLHINAPRHAVFAATSKPVTP
jgi:hypothetical protein